MKWVPWLLGGIILGFLLGGVGPRRELSRLNEDTFNLDLIVMGLLCRSGITCHIGVKSRLAMFFNISSRCETQ